MPSDYKEWWCNRFEELSHEMFDKDYWELSASESEQVEAAVGDSFADLVDSAPPSSATDERALMDRIQSNHYDALTSCDGPDIDDASQSGEANPSDGHGPQLPPGSKETENDA